MHFAWHSADAVDGECNATGLAATRVAFMACRNGFMLRGCVGVLIPKIASMRV